MWLYCIRYYGLSFSCGSVLIKMKGGGSFACHVFLGIFIT